MSRADILGGKYILEAISVVPKFTNWRRDNYWKRKDEILI